MAEIMVALKSAGLDEKVRAQELSVKQWVKLYYLLMS
jgi:16S rRNA A1518/A1519 N6-dimethyltransferase RsmA/KsgA/DIM1 with predicted DNA glycosylase/AP lyase activity